MLRLVTRARALLVSRLRLGHKTVRPAGPEERIAQLGKVGSARAVRTLGRFADAEAGLAIRATQALREIGNRDAEIELLSFLGAGDERVAIAACDALASIGSKISLAFLSRLARGLRVPWKVHQAARSAVERIALRAQKLPHDRDGALSVIHTAEVGSVSLASDTGTLGLASEE